MKKGQKPTNFDYTWWKDNKTKGLKDDPKLQTSMIFLHNHYIHYPKLDVNSSDNKVMFDRVNMIRQMVAGIKQTKIAVEKTIKNCALLTHDADKAALKHYLVLLKTAENDRQNWIKIERGVGNTENVTTMLEQQGLDDRIPV